MKVVILAGGLGTRIAEETTVKPKPMVEIGGYPMLWHIMQLYSRSGFKEFVVALGYKGAVIKEYFLHYHQANSDFSVNLATGAVCCHRTYAADWNVHLIDTGNDTLTGGRLKRVESLVRPEGTFMLTYGDGVADIPIRDLLDFHRSHGRIATLTVVRPAARFGAVTFDGDEVIEFQEKPQTSEGWINGGFFVFEPEIFDYLDGDRTELEGRPLERLARDHQLMAYRHGGFWQCMDTLRDKNRLEALWNSGGPPWMC